MFIFLHYLGHFGRYIFETTRHLLFSSIDVCRYASLQGGVESSTRTPAFGTQPYSGMMYFLSCVTVMKSNVKRVRTQTDETGNRLCYPGVAYFLCFRRNEVCNENTIFAALHNADMKYGVNSWTKSSFRHVEHHVVTFEFA